MTFSPYMEQFQEWPFPYELMIPSGSRSKKSVLHFRDWLLSQENRMDSALAEMLQPVLADSSTDQRFFQLYGPLRLLMRTLEFNRTMLKSVSCPIQLYIAQSLIPNLAPALQGDVPTPDLVSNAGKGDVYGSSVWLGSEPTYTPLHRDPNPNLFYQLCGSKSLRIMPPAHGDRIFAQVQARLGRYGGSRIRTSEMMEGAERKLLYEMVWENEPQGEVYGVDVGPGDALFIPRGWWHSVKSAGAEGHLNSSVNWWFR
ncbi:Lysine-specific demethylase 8 [Escovopsis weberi]|uniref:Lysine-specific demethylase 8 n=1 Tax=Escovopsis weberi TaxID=150374 RepID=A0A0M9VUG1_ESCWE|nr:Lysine-specific demethylase 8 [Escovopsis weberi]